MAPFSNLHATLLTRFICDANHHRNGVCDIQFKDVVLCTRVNLSRPVDPLPDNTNEKIVINWISIRLAKKKKNLHLFIDPYVDLPWSFYRRHSLLLYPSCHSGRWLFWRRSWVTHVGATEFFQFDLFFYLKKTKQKTKTTTKQIFFFSSQNCCCCSLFYKKKGRQKKKKISSEFRQDVHVFVEGLCCLDWEERTKRSWARQYIEIKMPEREREEKKGMGRRRSRKSGLPHPTRTHTVRTTTTTQDDRHCCCFKPKSLFFFFLF